MVPISQARQLYAAAKQGVMVCLPEVGHTFGIAHPQQGEVLPSAMKELVEKVTAFITQDS